MWEIPIDAPLFEMKTASRASGVAAGTIRVWAFRGHVRQGEGHAKAATNGLPDMFTLRSLLVLAATGELVRLGSKPGEAFKCAEYWMNSGVAEGQEGAVARREAGGLFPKPYETYLIAGGDGSYHGMLNSPCRVEGVSPADKHAHSALFNALFFRGRGSAKIVWLNMIDRRVRQICHEATLEGGPPLDLDEEAIKEKTLRENLNGK